MSQGTLITVMYCLLGQPREVAALPLAQGGQAKAAIVLDAPAPQRQIAYAAQELTNWLFKVQ